MFKEVKLPNISRKYDIIKRPSRYEKIITSKNKKQLKIQQCVKHQSQTESTRIYLNNRPQVQLTDKDMAYMMK